MSGCWELNPVNMLPKHAYYRYTTPRKAFRIYDFGLQIFRHAMLGNNFRSLNLKYKIPNINCAEGENRTHDTMIFSHLLYH